MSYPLGLDYLITLDFESYYDTEYSLTKLTYIEYIQSPLFKLHGCAVQVNEGNPIWYHTMGALRKALLEIPWNKAGLIGHNLHYDGLVLAKKFDIFPKYYLDTIGIARAVLPTIESYSLDFLSKYLELGKKDSSPLANVKGILNPSKEQITALGEYCSDDVILTWKLYNTLISFMPEDELEILDITIRMQTQPQIILDKSRLEKIVEDELQDRKELLKKAKVDIYTIRSTAKLAEEFRIRGIDPPMKTSPTTGKQIPAFAKSDTGMMKLLANPDPSISNLAAARLKCMSSLEIKRAERFIEIHDCNDGVLPVTLNYYGAHTGRWSGGDKRCCIAGTLR